MSIKDIRSRHDEAEYWGRLPIPMDRALDELGYRYGAAHADRALLLAEVDRLTDQLDTITDGIRSAPDQYTISEAIKLARLWGAGKMIGGNGDAVRDALLAEVDRLRALCGRAGAHFDETPSGAEWYAIARDLAAELRKASE